jgi:hypothetical protein
LSFPQKGGRVSNCGKLAGSPEFSTI